jgi:transposase
MSSGQASYFGQAIRALQPRQMGALPLIEPILADLQVRETVNGLLPSQADVDLGQVVVLLVLNRLLAPQPLYEIQDWLGGTVLPEVLNISVQQAYDNRLGRTLDRLYPQLGELWQRLISRAMAVYQLDLTVLHWDLTSIYFEGAYADSQLASYGYSRDQRPDAKQITLEVDVTHEGTVPVLYRVLTGNTADITRPLPHLAALLHFLARPELSERHLRPLLVSDCKMITAEAVLAYHRHSLYYLGPLQDSTAVTAVLRSVPVAELAEHALAYRPQRIRPTDTTFVPYQAVWRAFTFEQGSERVTDRVLVVWSAGKERLDQEKRKTYLKRLLAGLAAVQKKLNTRRYKKRSYVEQRIATLQRGNPMQRLVDVDLGGEDEALSLRFALNRERLAEAQTLDGRYALATNGAHLSAEQALTLFKGQDGVEKRFRTIKGPLVVHPLFVRSDQRIEGLVFITLLALLVRALLERLCRQSGLALTADRLFDRFTSLQAVDVIWADGTVQRRAAQMSAFQAQLLAALGWPLPETYAHLPSEGADANR